MSSRWKMVIINDYTEFEFGTHRSDREYCYEESYSLLVDGRYAVRYWTNSDLPFCPYCGKFVSQFDKDDNGNKVCPRCENKQLVVSEKEVAERIETVNRYSNSYFQVKEYFMHEEEEGERLKSEIFCDRVESKYDDVIPHEDCSFYCWFHNRYEPGEEIEYIEDYGYVCYDASIAGNFRYCDECGRTYNLDDDDYRAAEEAVSQYIEYLRGSRLCASCADKLIKILRGPSLFSRRIKS